MKPKKILTRLILVLLVLIGLLLLAIFASNTLKQPSNNREWNTDQKILPTVTEVNDDTFKINNIRSFRYTSTDAYTANYTSQTVKLSELKSIDYILVPLGSPGAAHSFLTFGFENPTTQEDFYFSVSAEIRKEVGESFSALKGLFANYELMYVIADEADLIDLRARHRQNQIYMYPVKTSKDKMQQLLVSILSKTNQLAQTPEFYNTITNNCSINIKKHINLISKNKVPFDLRAILPEKSDELAYELELFDTNEDFPTLKNKSNITQKALSLTGLEPNYSQLLRAKTPEQN
jgi:hypothetical protein